MEESIGNLWILAKDGATDAVVITTNGFVKSSGEAVLGKGIALQARNRWPDLEARLGAALSRFGNRPFRFRMSGLESDLVSLPTKPAYTSDGRPGWLADSDLDLIVSGAVCLMEMADKFHWDRVVLPRPGVGAGRLDWDTVCPRLADVLDQRFTVLSLAS